MSLLEATGVTKTFAGITALDDVEPRRRRARDRRAHRAERRGQDDVLQLPARHPEARRRVGHASTGSDLTRVPDAPPGAARHRPHVPAHRAVRRHDAARAPPRRRPGPQRPRRAAGRTCSAWAGPTADEQRARAGDARAARARRGRRPPGRVAEPRRRPARRGRPRADDRAASCCCSTSRRRASTAPRPTSSARTLREVQRERGLAILLVEHDVELVRSFVERVFVLDFGTLIASGRDRRRCSPTSAVRKAYLGDMV